MDKKAEMVWFEIHYQGSRCEVVERKFARHRGQFLIDHDGGRVLIGEGELQKFFPDRPAAVAKAVEWQKWKIEELSKQLADAKKALVELR